MCSRRYLPTLKNLQWQKGKRLSCSTSLNTIICGLFNDVEFISRKKGTEWRWQARYISGTDNYYDKNTKAKNKLGKSFPGKIQMGTGYSGHTTENFRICNGCNVGSKELWFNWLRVCDRKWCIKRCIRNVDHSFIHSSFGKAG